MLDECGVAVESSSVLTEVTDDPGGVAVTSAQPDNDHGTKGSVRTMRCHYVIGADGSHSTVRDLIGATLQPTDERGRATRQIGARLTWARSAWSDRLWFLKYHNGFAGIMPIRGPERRGKHQRLDEQQSNGFERLMYRGRLAEAALKLAAPVVPDLGTKLMGASELQQSGSRTGRGR